jgi:hypothetical protein
LSNTMDQWELEWEQWTKNREQCTIGVSNEHGQ